MKTRRSSTLRMHLSGCYVCPKPMVTRVFVLKLYNNSAGASTPFVFRLCYARLVLECVRPFARNDVARKMKCIIRAGAQSHNIYRNRCTHY